MRSREMSKGLMWTMTLMAIVTVIAIAFISPAPAQDASCQRLEAVLAEVSKDHAVAEVKPVMLAALKAVLIKRSQGQEDTIKVIEETDRIVVAFGREPSAHVDVVHLSKGCAIASAFVGEANFMAIFTEAYGEGFALRGLLQSVTLGTGV